MLVLALEASTTAAKALLYESRGNGEGRVVAAHTENFGPDIDAGGLHDTEAVYRTLIRVGSAVASGKDVAAIGLGCVWHSIVACTDAMQPLTRTHVWNFTGAREISARFRADEDLAASIYNRTGCMPNAIYSLYNILLLRENGLNPEGKRFISQGGYNFYRLTGHVRETRNIASGTGLLNIATHEYDEELLALCGINAVQMGELTDFTDTRPLLPEAARELGIKPGIPVVPSHADGTLNQLGNGALRSGQMTFSVGTSAAIRLSTAMPFLTNPPATWCYPGVSDWMAGAATNGACNCVNWLKERVLQNRWTFAELEDGLLDETRTPFFLPFLFGERCPGWNDNRLGGFEMLGGTETPQTLFRSVSEGVLFNIYQCYRHLTAAAGYPDRIILSGGILHSPAWVQMAADIFGLPMHVSDNPNASLLGGVAVALHAVGALPDLTCFGERELDTVSPRPGAGDYYHARFQRYLELYNNQIA